jgi:hypothetical protein
MRIDLLRRGSLLALAGLALAPAALAQSTNPRPAPQWLLNTLDLHQATVQDLQVPLERRTFRFQVELAGKLFAVELEPNDVRSPDFKLLVDDGLRIRELPTPASVTFVGHVVGQADSRAAATLVDGKLDATISLGADDHEIWGIEAVANFDLTRPLREHVVYTTTDARVSGTSCGADDGHWQPIGQPGLDLVMKRAEIAIDCDLEFYQRNSSSVTTTQNTVTRIVNGFDAIYQRDCEIQYTITTILVRTTRTYTNTNMGNLLGEFRGRWNANHGNIRRDVAHLFTGKGSFGGVVGIAYLGVVCDTGNAYGVDKAFSSLGTNIGLVAHELGHNWNAPHCDGANPCNIMCSGLGGCNSNLSSFGQVSVNTIVAFKNSRGCLDNAVSRPTIAGISPNATPVAPRALVTLTGNNFNGVTSVNVGNLQVPAAIQSNTQLTFTPPLPPAFGIFPVTVTNAAGTSNAVSMSFSRSPGFYAAQNQAFTGGTISFSFAGDPNDNWWILSSFTGNSTVPFLGFDILTNTLVLSAGALDGLGVGSLLYNVPANVNMFGVVMYSQVIQLEETTPALNWASSPAQTIFIF